MIPNPQTKPLPIVTKPIETNLKIKAVGLGMARTKEIEQYVEKNAVRDRRVPQIH